MIFYTNLVRDMEMRHDSGGRKFVSLLIDKDWQTVWYCNIPEAKLPRWYRDKDGKVYGILR